MAEDSTPKVATMTANAAAITAIAAVRLYRAVIRCRATTSHRRESHLRRVNPVCLRTARKRVLQALRR
jgi:hypothetical protein